MATANPFRFSTKFQDDETGLLYYLYRYYDPSLQRWINRDPIAEHGGINVFAFAQNFAAGTWDYYGMGPGQEYKTCDEAAIDAIKRYVDDSIREDREYSGAIYMNPNGTFSYTTAKRGPPAAPQTYQKESTSPDRIPIPAGTSLAGGYHTHGAYHPDEIRNMETGYGCRTCTFSDDDERIHDELGKPGYLGTPASEIQKYTPDVNKKGKGCIELLWSPSRHYPAVLTPPAPPKVSPQPPQGTTNPPPSGPTNPVPRNPPS